MKKFKVGYVYFNKNNEAGITYEVTSITGSWANYKILEGTDLGPMKGSFMLGSPFALNSKSHKSNKLKEAIDKFIKENE